MQILVSLASLVIFDVEDFAEHSIDQALQLLEVVIELWDVKSFIERLSRLLQGDLFEIRYGQLLIQSLVILCPIIG